MVDKSHRTEPLQQSRSWLPPNAYQYFVAGGLGAMCGAIVTSPFDVVKTRLQSDLFAKHSSATAARGGSGLLRNFVETGHILRNIYRDESPRALFKGLGTTLVGTVPARAINFFTYGNGKQLIAAHFNGGREDVRVHLAAAACAGVVTSICTNPLWVIKTRLQLVHGDADVKAINSRGGRVWTMVSQIAREEGMRGFYKGLSASLLGVTEGTIQWALYEQLKRLTAGAKGRGGFEDWLGIIGSSGTAKCVATVITYPHEVIRTRLRQPLVDGKVKYTGLVQTLRLVVAEEGARSLYGGLTAHLMRVIPNAAIMFTVYEAVLRH